MRALGAVEPPVTRAVVETLFDWLSARLPGTSAAYLAMEGEVEVGRLFDRLPGWRWVLPRIELDGSLTLRDRDLERERHPWGMSQPVDAGDPVPLHEVDLILVPGVAFDRRGTRLGRGKGYYDRMLAERRTDCVAVGVTSSDRVMEEVPIEAHDRRVDYVATESEVMVCSTRS